MPTLILDSEFEEQTLAQRRALGLDRFDEVWDGVYITAPLANNEHQHVSFELGHILRIVCDGLSPVILTGCNVSDQEANWKSNYRCPDVAVYFPANPAGNMTTHWFGGPDFAVEVASNQDQTWDKLDFYTAVNTRELLVIDREPWQLSLLRLEGNKLVVVGVSTLENKTFLQSVVLPVAFQLVPRDNLRPLIEVRHLHDGRSWNIDPTIRGR